MGQAAAGMAQIGGGKGHVHVRLWASLLPKLKQWSEWEMDFALSMVERFGRGAGAGVE